MKADRRTTKRCTPLRDARGYSLVELSIAIGVAAVVGLGIYAVFNYSQKSSLSQKIYNDMQTSCNFAMDQIKAELLLAGYRARDQVRPISNAAGDTITFEYFDDDARDEAPYAVGYDNNTQVTFRRLVNGDLLREMQRHIPGTGYDAGNVTTQTLATNVGSLSFGYLASDNAVWNGIDVKDIRAIRPTLVCNASRVDPNTKKTPQLTLTGEVRARNVGVASSATDTTPPQTPTGLIAWDPGECGKIELRWDANTDADLDGYTIFYGLASGSYAERIVVTRAPKTSGNYEYLTVTGLDSTITGVTPEPQYYFAINSYDKSGNISVGLSNEASGNPSPSARTAAAAAGGSDTTVHPLVPTAPVAFTATPGDSSATLTWTPSPATGLKGYRLYRSQTAATFTPDDTPGTGNRIADETILDNDAVSYTDTGLLGCTEYYYKIAAIACDSAVPIASRQFASVTVTPADTVRPSAPVIAARPGYRRIILTLTNPVRTGPGSEPDFSYTRIYWSKSGYPILNPDGTVTPNQPIPRSKGATMPNTPVPPDGTFSDPGSLTGTINFNDETSSSASAPNLAPDTTYFFRAVAYDLCGNSSDATSSSTAEGTQCGDCLLPAPAAPGTPDPDCYGAPPVPANVRASGCFGYVDLSWDPIDDIVVRDFQGFRLLRREGESWFGGNAATEVSLTGADAAWLTTFRDASVLPGKAYSYRVMSTDCYYEQHNGKPAAEWPEPGNDPSDNFADAFVNNIAVGQIVQDPVLDHVVTGYLQPDPPTLPLTVSTADGLTSVPPTFQHNAVTLWAKNSAASAVTLEQMTSSWENAEAYLQQVAFGDGETTPVTIAWKDTGSPLTNSSTGSAVTFVPASRLLAVDDRIPFVTLYKNADGSVSAGTDQRQQTVDFTLTYRNDSTATSGCGVTDSYYVPLGPYVYGVAQDQPSVGTRAWPVPGDQGGNSMNVITVGGGTKVSVFANVYDSRGAGLSAVKLYYYVDSAKSLTAAPPLAATAQFPNLPPYTAIDLAPVAGSQWRTPQSPIDNRIPVNDGANVWFFIVAVDNAGNFDREPEIGSGAFQYYQAPANVCATTPNGPTLVGSATDTDVTLTWTAPTKNTSGSDYTDGRGYKIFRDHNGAGFTLLATIDDRDAVTYTDAAVPDLQTATYRYYVTAYDMCLPTPKESVASAIYTELVENPCNSTPNSPELAGSTNGGAGSVTLTWTAPTTNTSGTPLTDLLVYWIWRKKDLGSWTWLDNVSSATLTYTDSGLADIGTADYQYFVEAVDSCTPSANRSAPSNVYTDQYITTNPCDTTPGLVTGLTATTVDSTVGVVLTWDAPTTQSTPAGWPYNDAGGFNIWRAEYNPDGTWTGVAGVVMTTPANQTTWTDSGVAATVGALMYRYWVLAFDTCVPPKESPSWTGPYTETYTDPCISGPGAPTGLAAAGSGTGVTLTWVAPSPDPGDLDGYEIERKAGTAGTWASITGSPFHPWALSQVDNVTDASLNEYWYRVRALDSCPAPSGPKFSPWSNEAQESYTDPCGSIPNVPAAPALAVTAVTSSNCTNKNTNLSVTWAGPAPFSDANSTLFYRIYRCPTSKESGPPADCTNKVYPASESPLPVQNDLTEMVPTGGLKPSEERIWIWVEAVSAKTGCATTSWKTLKSAPMKDACGL